MADWKPEEVKAFDAEVRMMRDAMLHPMHRGDQSPSGVPMTPTSSAAASTKGGVPTASKTAPAPTPDADDAEEDPNKAVREKLEAQRKALAETSKKQAHQQAQWYGRKPITDDDDEDPDQLDDEEGEEEEVKDQKIEFGKPMSAEQESMAQSRLSQGERKLSPTERATMEHRKRMQLGGTHIEHHVDSDDLTVPEQHQAKVAKQSLRMPQAMLGVMGGPSKPEAKEILKRQKDDAISPEEYEAYKASMKGQSILSKEQLEKAQAAQEAQARSHERAMRHDDVEPSELPHEHAEVEKAARREEGLEQSGKASPERHQTAEEHSDVLREAATVLEKKL